MADSRLLSSGSFIFNRNLGSNHFDSRVTGSRTGTTATGVRNLIVTAEQNGRKLISVVLGSTSEINPDGSTGFYKETRILLDKGFNEMDAVQVFYDNLVVNQFDVINGSSAVSVCVKENIVTTVPKNVSNDDLTYRYNMVTPNIEAPIFSGDKVGTVQIWYEDTCLAETDLFTLHNVELQEVIATQNYAEESEVSAKSVLIIIVFIVGLLIVLLFGRPLIFRMVRHHQIRRRKKNARRRR
jgi:D-alanyl-D-alanine carboxypeptidase